MSEPAVARDDQKFMALLEESSNQLVDKLQNNDYENASEIIHKLIDARDAHIFNSVGQLTRGLHSAIVNFHVDAKATVGDGEDKSEISDASDRLNYVLDLTQNAADKTMDRVEAAAPIAMTLGEQAKTLQAEWKKLKRREIGKEEFKELYTNFDQFLDKMGEGTESLNEHLQAIILEQGFQDLTGQVLKKVIGLITDVESELVNLMRIAGQVEEVAGLASEDSDAEDDQQKRSVEAEGPIMHADKRDDVVNGQDDVDDLLSSLGF